MIEKIMNKLIKLNNKAKLNGDVPVSCVIVQNNKIIASGYNRKVIDNDPFAHAEIIAIKMASKKLKTYNLNDCTLYVSLEPCNMCRCVIDECRIKKVFYIINSEKKINSTTKYENMFVNNEYFINELKSFFLDKR